MKFKYIFPILAAACLLTACGGRKTETDKTAATNAVTTSESTSKTTVTTTKVTTTSATTTKKIDPPADLVLKGLDSVEVYSEVSFDSFITEKNVELKDGSTLLNTSDTGVYEVDIPYTYNGGDATGARSIRIKWN